MQVPDLMPTLPGRTPHDRGWLTLWTVGLGVMVLGALLAALFLPGPMSASPDPESVLWLLFVAAALVADGWASTRAFREAQDSENPRAVNRWDVSAMALAFGSSAALALVLALTPSESPSPARVLTMTLASGALLSWFAVRAYIRTRLPASQRGWPLDGRGTPRVPRGMRIAFSPHAWLGFALLFGVGGDSGDWSGPLLAPLWLTLAAESAANTRRTSDAWWGRPLTAFGVADILELLCGLAGVLLACAVSFSVIIRRSEMGALAFAALVAVVSVFHVAKILSRRRRRTVA